MVVTNGRRRSLRAAPPLVSKALISAAIGALAFLVTQGLDADIGADTLVGFGVSVFLGGVAFVIQFLMEAERRLDALSAEVEKLADSYNQHANATEQMIQAEFRRIHAEFGKINAATKLFGAVEASALKTDAMTQLVERSTTIEVGSPPLIFAFAQAEIARLSGYLLALGQRADVYYDGEDRDWLLGLTRVATKSIDATSLTSVDAGARGFVDGGLWESDLGRRYVEVQKAAIARGVTIRRLVILDRQGLQDHPELRKVVEDQVAIGVTIRLLEPRKVTPGIRRYLVDFIVIDDVLVYRSTAAAVEEATHPVIESTRLITEPAQVRDRGLRFAELWALGRPYPQVLPAAVRDEDVIDPIHELRGKLEPLA